MNVGARLITLLLSITLPLTVLAIATPLNDVFSLPKLLILCALGYLLVLTQIQTFTKEMIIKQKFAFSLLLLFILSHLFLSLTTDQTYRAFVGSYGRNNGFIEYTVFAIFFVGATVQANHKTINHILTSLNLTISAISIYAILQSFKLDFIAYNSGEFREVTTLGNVNFTSALIGISLPVSIWKISSARNSSFKIFNFVVLLINLSGLYCTTSTQGKILAAFGSFLLVGFWIHHQNRCYFKIYATGFLVASILTLLGLFQKGPIKNYVYENSISNRGDYFRAAWRMFLSEPLRGVGIESFSDFYLRNIDIATYGRVGAETSTQYAHNVFFQFLATGGLILTIPYFVFVLYISFKAICLVRRMDQSQRLQSWVIVIVWFLYLAQLQISIEHPAIGLLGWLFGGLILNLSQESVTEHRGSYPLTDNLFKKGRLFLLVYTPISFILAFTASQLFIADANFNSYNLSQKNDFQAFKRRVAAHNPFENYYALSASAKLANSGELRGASILAVDVLNKNQNDFDAAYILAQVYSLLGEKELEIIYREKGFVLNPYLDDNIYKLGVAYKELNQNSELENLMRVVSARPGSSSISAQLAGLG